MMYLMYMSNIFQNVAKIKYISKINIHIENNPKHKDIHYSITFENLNYLYMNEFIFSIYKDTKKEQISHYSFIDKDILYLYEDKTKAKFIDYESIHEIWLKAFNNNEIKTKKHIMYMDIPLLDFYKSLKNCKDVSQLIKDINYVKDLDKNNHPIKELPKSIAQELET